MSIKRNRPCPKCGETYANGTDLVIKDGKVYDAWWLECDSCGHGTKPRLKYLGLESEMFSTEGA